MLLLNFAQVFATGNWEVSQGGMNERGVNKSDSMTIDILARFGVCTICRMPNLFRWQKNVHTIWQYLQKRQVRMNGMNVMEVGARIRIRAPIFALSSITTLLVTFSNYICVYSNCPSVFSHYIWFHSHSPVSRLVSVGQ